jgi:hypothetical protein
VHRINQNQLQNEEITLYAAVSASRGSTQEDLRQAHTQAVLMNGISAGEDVKLPELVSSTTGFNANQARTGAALPPKTSLNYFAAAGGSSKQQKNQMKRVLQTSVSNTQMQNFGANSGLKQGKKNKSKVNNGSTNTSKVYANQADITRYQLMSSGKQQKNKHFVTAQAKATVVDQPYQFSQNIVSAQTTNALSQ